MAKCEGQISEDEAILEEALPFGRRETTFHLLALNICCAFASLSMVLSLFHIMQHALHYLRPYEQKHIIRILAVIPVYACTTFLAYVFYTNAVYFELVRECYAAYAVVSFFTLMCHYIAPDLHEQKVYFRNMRPMNWGWPLNWIQKLTGGENKGCLRKPRSGVTWFNICYIGIFQYCILRTILTIIAGITQSFGNFCKGDQSPRYASLWTAIFDAISVLIAIYCIEQIYRQLKGDLAPNKPVLKMLSVKLIVFLTFWQTWLISLLIRHKVLTSTKYVADQDIRVGILCLLTSVEILIFAIVHRWAFPWKPYDIDRLPKCPEQSYECGPNEALFEAINPWDYFCAVARGFRWLFHGVHARKQDPSYGKNAGFQGRDGVKSDPLHGETMSKSGQKGKEQRKTA